MSSQKPTRRQAIAGGLAAAAAAGLGYGLGAEPRWIEERIVPVRLRRPVGQPVRVLHLSDLHRSGFVGLDFLESAIVRGLEQTPDLICLTGDYVTAGSSSSLDGYAEVLSLLSRYAPTYAVLGNHDGGSWSEALGGESSIETVSKLLDAAEIELLENRSASVEVAGGRLRLVGVGDLWGGDCDPDGAFRDAPESKPTLLLAHNPDTKDVAVDQEWELMLCGHTHGGQVVFPIVGPPIVPVKDRRFVAGLNPWQDRQIYTTRGIGNLYGLRVNCRPEITLLDLT